MAEFSKMIVEDYRIKNALLQQAISKLMQLSNEFTRLLATSFERLNLKTNNWMRKILGMEF